MRELAYVAVGIAALAALLIFGKGYADCEARGGAYVKGAVWYECVATQP